MIFYLLTLPKVIIMNSDKINKEESKLKNRTEIDDIYKWNLNDIYSSEILWETDFKWVEDNFSKLLGFDGKLGESAETLSIALNLDEDISIKLERLYLYSMLAKDSDMRDAKYIGMNNRIKTLFSKVASASSFIRPELLSINESSIREFINGNNALNKYQHFFEELLRTKKHTLDKNTEALLAEASEIAAFPYDAFSIFTNSDMEFPSVENENGENIKVSPGRYQSALYSNDRNYREKMFKAYYAPYKTYSNTLASLFNANLKSKHFMSKARKYQNTLESSLDNNNIPVRVYETLIEMVSKNLEPLHRWMKLKKQLLNLAELHPYDVYVSVFEQKSSRVYSYEEGVELVKNSLKIMGTDYQSILNTAFSNRWIDVFETEGKRSGAYSSGTTFGVHPYVLLNWNGILNDIFTLTHEMGHNVHSYLTGTSQPFIYADYSIFVAEIASTFNEALLFDYLLENTSSKEEKLCLLEKYLNNIVATFYRQTMFAEFELQVYRNIENGQAITSDTLCELYSSIYSKYMGPSLTIDAEEQYTWARVPHFYYNYYVYQYATGLAASEQLASKVKKEGKPAINDYLDFLKAGKSDYPLSILKKAGVDMLTPEPVAAVSARMTFVLNQIEELLK